MDEAGQYPVRLLALDGKSQKEGMRSIREILAEEPEGRLAVHPELLA